MKSVVLEKVTSLNHQASEAYKSLRSNIEFCGDDVRVIAVTSCLPNDGKSSTAFNLAKYMAENGDKVLFIDADLRKSVMVGRYKATGQITGLSSFLSGRCSADEVLYSTNIQNLHMIFAGHVPPNPAELLGNKFFRVLIDSGRKYYDYVIIDTPPLGAVIDSAIVAKECDGVILVVSQGNIRRRFAIDILSQLKKANVRVLGAVLNKVDMESDSYYGRYYGKYYGKYYGQYYGKSEGEK